MAGNPEDDEFYARAAIELADKTHDTAIMARAWAETGGSPDATTSAYIRLRVERLRSERQLIRQQAAVVQRAEQKAAKKAADLATYGETPGCVKVLTVIFLLFLAITFLIAFFGK